MYTKAQDIRPLQHAPASRNAIRTDVVTEIPGALSLSLSLSLS